MAKRKKRAPSPRKKRGLKASAAEPTPKVAAKTPGLDAIVIGTGFGGAVTACRLAQAGFNVLILERGRRYQGPGASKFPRDFSLTATGWLWGKDRGLFDARLQDRIVTVQAAGYGGGSLVYANVHIQPPPEIFAEGWPRGYNPTSLQPYYNLVAYMFNLSPILAGASGLPPKSEKMKEAAKDLNRRAQFFFPNLAVNFGQPRDLFQGTINAPDNCNYCGECVIGCNDHAKNTLDLNYLQLADGSVNAKVQTDCEVKSIRRLENGGYVVNYVDLAHDQFADAVAPRVFLCAGAINSTELLLRCRDEYRTLPDLSPHVGRGFSGNGDFIAFAFDTEAALQPSVGPTITSAVVYKNKIGSEPVWFLVEDGGYPAQIADLVQRLNPLGPPKGTRQKIVDGQHLFAALRALAPRALGKLAVRDPALPFPSPREDHVAVLLAMGRDRTNGRIRWGPGAPQAWVDWDVRSNLPLYDEEQRLATDFAEAGFNGTVAVSPLWKRLRLPISVHNLGGCPMSENAGDGVVDQNGQVWGYPNLYVFDGSILPASTGVNPSHTIAAVAERNVEAAIRSRPSDANWTANPKWTAPQMAAANLSPVPEPMPSVTTYTNPPGTKGITIQFTETLVGKWRPLGFGGEFDADLTVSIETPLLDEFLIDKEHICPMDGVFRATGLTDPDGAIISNGTFRLFVADPQQSFYTRQMVYAFNFNGISKQTYAFQGYKTIKDHELDKRAGRIAFLADIWVALTRLTYFVNDDAGILAGDGRLDITAGGVLDQLRSMTVPGSRGWRQKTWQEARLAKFFFGNIFDVYIRSRYPTGINRRSLPK